MEIIGDVLGSSSASDFTAQGSVMLFTPCCTCTGYSTVLHQIQIRGRNYMPYSLIFESWCKCAASSMFGKEKYTATPQRSFTALVLKTLLHLDLI